MAVFGGAGVWKAPHLSYILSNYRPLLQFLSLG